MLTKFYNVNGNKTALLVHGYGSGINHAWEKTIELLTSNNVNVLALELTGHGESSRQNSYSFNDWITSIKNILHKTEITPDYIVGHSLGGLLATGIADKISFEKILLLDPFLYIRSDFIHWVTRISMRHQAKVTYRKVRKSNPTWTRQMVIDEVKSLRQWDLKTLDALDRTGKPIVERFIKTNESKTLILKPKHSFLIPSKFIPVLKTNKHINVEIIPDSRHSLHKDNEKAYLKSLTDFFEI